MNQSQIKKSHSQNRYGILNLYKALKRQSIAVETHQLNKALVYKILQLFQASLQVRIKGIVTF